MTVFVYVANIIPTKEEYVTGWVLLFLRGLITELCFLGFKYLKMIFRFITFSYS